MSTSMEGSDDVLGPDEHAYEHDSPEGEHQRGLHDTVVGPACWLCHRDGRHAPEPSATCAHERRGPTSARIVYQPSVELEACLDCGALLTKRRGFGCPWCYHAGRGTP